MKKSIFTLIAIMLATSFASALSVTESRKFRLEAFRALSNYERYVQWANEERYLENAMELFESANAPHYNDLLGIADADTLPISVYLNTLGVYAEQINIKLKDFKMSPITYKNGKWVLDVTFYKEINYTAKDCEILFSNYYYDNVDYKMTAHFVWNEATQTCQIQSIDGSIASKKPHIGTDYAVIKHTSEYDDNVSVDGNKLSFDPNFHQALVPSKAIEGNISFPDPDMTVTIKGPERQCPIYWFTYHPKQWRIKPYFTLGLGSYYKMTTNTNFTLDNDSSSGMEFGVDVGYALPMLSRLKIALYAGLGLSSSKLDLGITGGSFEYVTDQDIDGDRYRRQYSDVNLTQSMSFKDLIIPIYAEFELPVAGRVSAYLDLGLKMYMAMGASSSNITGTYKVQGLYEQYDNLIFDYESGINGFTNNGTINSNASTVDIERKSMSMDVFGRIGVRIPVYKSLAVDISASFQSGIGDCYSNTTPASDLQPLRYNISTDTENVNLPDAVSKFSRQMLGVSLGLTYKF